ncbi:MFS transporter [Phaeosphaeriaceae sp. PMI808]|nr:MFS transporter [Phaeosphaeriaceae sp. PMI808]
MAQQVGCSLEPQVNAQTVATEARQDDICSVLAGYTGNPEWTDQEATRLVRRIDKRLMPLLFITYGLQYYDKAMLSQAALFGLQEDLGLQKGSRYSFAASIFYIGFIFGSYPAMLMAQRWRIERVAAGIVFAWGVCLMSSAACTSWQGFYAQRFSLGFLESGVSPLFMLIVGSWYQNAEQAFRIGVWYSATGYFSIISPLVNYGVGHVAGGQPNSWRYMYIVAGAITIVWSFVVLVCLPPEPSCAYGFNARERYIAIARLRPNNSGVRNKHFKSSHLYESLKDIKFGLVFLIAFLMMIANGPVSSFIPIIINEFGFDRLHSLLLFLPAGAVIGTMVLAVTYIARRILDIRTWMIVMCQCGTIVASTLLWKLPRSELGGLLFACYFLASYSGGYAVLMSLQMANTAGYTKKSVTSSGLFVGYCLGNFLGPMLFKSEEAPIYATGFITVLATSAAAAVLAVIYRYICIWDNRKRDKIGSERFDHAFDDNRTDLKNHQFRYKI